MSRIPFIIFMLLLAALCPAADATPFTEAMIAPVNPKPFVFDQKRWAPYGAFSVSPDGTSINAVNCSQETETICKDPVTKYFAISMTMRPNGVGPTDGKILCVEDSAGAKINVAIGDDYPFGIWDRKKRGWVAEYIGPKPEVGKDYKVEVRYLAEGIVARLTYPNGDTSILSTKRALKPPFTLSFAAQRTGMKVSNVQIGD